MQTGKIPHFPKKRENFLHRHTALLGILRNVDLNQHRQRPSPLPGAAVDLLRQIQPIQRVEQAYMIYYIFNFVVAFVMEAIEKKLDYYR